MQKINLRELYPDVYKTDVFVDVAEDVVAAIRGQEQDDAAYERHCFFTEQLIAAGVDPKTAEADACRIEHIISDESFDRLKEAAAQKQE